MQQSVLLRRQNAKICIMVVPMVAIEMVNLRTFKKLTNKRLRNKTMYKKRLASHMTRRAVAQSNLYVRQCPSIGRTFFLL